MHYEIYTNENGESVAFPVTRDGFVLEPDLNDPNDDRNNPYHWEGGLFPLSPHNHH